MYHIAICDDDKIYIDYLKEVILGSGVDKEEVLFYEYDSGENFLNDISNLKRKPLPVACRLHCIRKNMFTLPFTEPPACRVCRPCRTPAFVLFFFRILGPHKNTAFLIIIISERRLKA